MGQSASRARPLRSPPPPQHEDNTHPEPGSSRPSPSASRTTSNTSKRSRRSSLRRSLLSFVPRSESSGSVRSTSSTSAESSQSLKKRWRSSFARRSSKVPVSPQMAELRQESESGSSPVLDECTAGTPANLPAPESLVSSDPPPEEDAQTTAMSQGRAQEQELPVDEGTSELPGEPPDQDVPNDPVAGSDGAAETEAVPAEPLPNVEGEIGQQAVDNPPAPPEPLSEPAPEAESPPQAPRQFPPPGTLVVVQGVVNTTDVPSIDRATPPSRQPSRSATPRPPSGLQGAAALRRSVSASVSATRDGERRDARNRLSSFINRARPSSDLAEVPTSHRHSTTPSDLSSSVNSQDAVSADESASDDHESPRDETDGRPRPLSPGSIDVLGTLLSVAAAATAASLFSPGLAFQGTNNTGMDGNRPMSPTPTAGLGNLAGLGSLAGLGLDPAGAVGQGQGGQARDGRDRIRNVWESVRDRLGLHPRGQSDASGPSESDNTNEIRMRPGEMMLAEMARALNIGLGLGDGNVPGTRPAEQGTGGDSLAGTNAGDLASRPARESAERPSPPEDSFERFLLNLQADLRAALSEDTGTARETRNSIASSAPSAFAVSSEQEEPVAGPSAIHRRSSDSAQMADTAIQTTEQDGDADSLPPLRDVSDSDSDSDEDEEDEDEDDDSHEDQAERSDLPGSPRTPTPIPTGTFPLGPDHRHTGGDGERRPPGVNLWRLYRFAPIPASHTIGHAASTSTAPASPPADAPVVASPEAPTTAEEPDTASTVDVSPGADSAETNPTPSTTLAADQNTNVVVPVIVVGLQSVDMNRHDNHAEAAPPQDEARTSESDSGSSAEWRDAPVSGSNQSQSQARGRTWQSRAASALRGLRPGRRGSRNRQSTDSTGARTFLIYVIGGYYPPNHHMVTGSDSLDSYEALWELAELLGQVKPPVATREDIDNSGLQIIKSSELSRYEEEGRVASNCVERCLICLEDYEPEEELRLMSCKHAYHKDCVDKWLQVGRNNCPACRTRGVSTAGDTASS